MQLPILFIVFAVTVSSAVNHRRTFTETSVTRNTKEIHHATLQDLILSSQWWKPEYYGSHKSSPYKNTQQAIQKLDSFIYQLKSFIKDSHFDTFQFELVQDMLASEVIDIRLLAGDSADTNERIRMSMMYAMFMFETMVDAAYSLKVYEPIKQVENYLLNRIIDVNVRILGLFNAQGTIDTTIVGFKEKLVELWTNTFFWKANFFNLQGISKEDRSFFRAQANQAIEILTILLDSIDDTSSQD